MNRKYKRYIFQSLEFSNVFGIIEGNRVIIKRPFSSDLAFYNTNNIILFAMVDYYRIHILTSKQINKLVIVQYFGRVF